MEEQIEYGSRLNSAKVADLILTTDNGWQEVKQGILNAASELIKSDDNLYHALSILDSRRKPTDPA